VGIENGLVVKLVKKFGGFSRKGWVKLGKNWAKRLSGLKSNLGGGGKIGSREEIKENGSRGLK